MALSACGRDWLCLANTRLLHEIEQPHNPETDEIGPVALIMR